MLKDNWRFYRRKVSLNGNNSTMTLYSVLHFSVSCLIALLVDGCSSAFVQGQTGEREFFWKFPVFLISFLKYSQGQWLFLTGKYIFSVTRKWCLWTWMLLWFFYDCFWLLSLVRRVAMSQKKICLPFLTELHRLKFIHGKCFTVQ